MKTWLVANSKPPVRSNRTIRQIKSLRPFDRHGGRFRMIACAVITRMMVTGVLQCWSYHIKPRRPSAHTKTPVRSNRTIRRIKPRRPLSRHGGCFRLRVPAVLVEFPRAGPVRSNHGARQPTPSRQSGLTEPPVASRRGGRVRFRLRVPPIEQCSSSWSQYVFARLSRGAPARSDHGARQPTPNRELDQTEPPVGSNYGGRSVVMGSAFEEERV